LVSVGSTVFSTFVFSSLISSRWRFGFDKFGTTNTYLIRYAPQYMCMKGLFSFHRLKWGLIGL
jgi:hypothetical protein